MSTIDLQRGVIELSERDRRRIAARIAEVGTQSQCARRCGLHQGHLSQLLTGDRLARPHIWERICQQVGLELRLSVSVVAPRKRSKRA